MPRCGELGRGREDVVVGGVTTEREHRVVLDEQERVADVPGRPRRHELRAGDPTPAGTATAPATRP